MTVIRIQAAVVVKFQTEEQAVNQARGPLRTGGDPFSPQTEIHDVAIQC